MTDAASDVGAGPRLLFVPVSGRYGMGEYARSLAIARAASAEWPGARIHFVLSRAAPYAATAPFPTTLLPASATFHSADVIELLARFRPDVAIFDNAGRTAQLRAAVRLGARVVYISARGRQRRKAFRPRWMRLLAEHWIAYPEFIAGSLGAWERCKLRWLRRPAVRYLDVISTRPDPARRATILGGVGCAAGTYVLFVPGGGTGHPGAQGAVEEFLAAARGIAAAGIPVVFVGAPQQSPPAAATAAASGAGVEPAAGGLHLLGAVPQAELAELLRSARLVVANGGSTLLQAIAAGAACVAVPIAADQGARIRGCERRGVAVAAPLDSGSIARAALTLLADDGARAALASRAVALGLADGVEVAVRALRTLLTP